MKSILKMGRGWQGRSLVEGSGRRSEEVVEGATVQASRTLATPYWLQRSRQQYELRETPKVEERETFRPHR